MPVNSDRCLELRLLFPTGKPPSTFRRRSGAPWSLDEFVPSDLPLDPADCLRDIEASVEDRIRSNLTATATTSNVGSVPSAAKISDSDLCEMAIQTW